MLRPLLLLVAVGFGAPFVIAAGCSDPNLTNVGSILVDGSAAAADVDAATTFDSANALDSASPDSAGATDANKSDGAASSDAQADAPVDAPPNLPCPAGECGTKLCGRDECGQVCGTCPSPGPNGGCIIGMCIVQDAAAGIACPGTPCIDDNGEQICESARGGVACAGGTLGIKVCTCTGGGPTAWADCGPCL